MTGKREGRKHAEPAAGTSEPPTSNPFASPANVLISVPESVEIRLVDASVLADYEIWSLAATVSVNFLTGFVVAYCQTKQDDPAKAILFACAIFSLIISGLMGYMAFGKRRSLSQKTRRFRLGSERLEEVE